MDPAESGNIHSGHVGNGKIGNQEGTAITTRSGAGKQILSISTEKATFSLFLILWEHYP
jgi:hypothetical protein